MPFVVKNMLPKIMKFNGSHTKPEGERFAFMPADGPGSERVMTDEELETLRGKPGFAALEAERSFLVWPAPADAQVEAPKAQEPAPKGKKAKAAAAAPAPAPVAGEVDPQIAALAAGLVKS